MLLFTAATLHAQLNEVSMSADNKTPNTDVRNNKKEKREERRELRKLEGKEVSYQSKQNFYVDFGDVPNVTWQRSSYYDEAHFTKDNKEMTAFYDNDGKLVGTTTPKTFADLPASAQKLITKRYKGYEVERVIFFDDNEANDTDMLLYGNQFDDADNFFVELKKDNQQIVLHSDMLGNVSFFKQLN